MLTLWLAAGLLAASNQEQPQAETVSPGWDFYRPKPRKKSKAEEDEQREALERQIREEAERQAEEALAAFEAEERRKYLMRLDQLVAMQPAPIASIDPKTIAAIAEMAVQALLSELEAEFDLYVARLEMERDEEEALIALLLAA